MVAQTVQRTHVLVVSGPDRGTTAEGTRSDPRTDRFDPSAVGAVSAFVAVAGQVLAAVVSSLPGALADPVWPGGLDLPVVEWSNRTRVGTRRRNRRWHRPCLPRRPVVFPGRPGRTVVIPSMAREIVWPDH